MLISTSNLIPKAKSYGLNAIRDNQIMEVGVST
nr:MAG TPA: hypothetical protein [Caudoviricetes sp.]